jgi:hypothetical protein
VDQGFRVLGVTAAVLLGQVEQVPNLIGRQGGEQGRSPLFGSAYQRNGSLRRRAGMRSGWWRGSSGVMADFDRIDTIDQLSNQTLGVVAGIFQGDGREVPDLHAAALATDTFHHAVGLVAARIDAFALNADFSNTG